MRPEGWTKEDLKRVADITINEVPLMLKAMSFNADGAYKSLRPSIAWCFSKDFPIAGTLEKWRVTVSKKRVMLSLTESELWLAVFDRHGNLADGSALPPVLWNTAYSAQSTRRGDRWDGLHGLKVFDAGEILEIVGTLTRGAR